MQTRMAVFIALLFFSQTGLAENEIQTVERFIRAFNDKDVDIMLKLSAANLHWMSIAGQQVSVHTSTADQLRASMQGYFESMPSAKSNIRSIHASGSFVYAVEQATWLAGEVEKSQCSLAVYELNNSKIQHVWYFPEHNC